MTVSSRTPIRLAVGVALAAAAPCVLPGQAAAPPAVASSPFDFSIPNIMRGPELYGRAPRNIHFTPDGKWIYFQWNAPGTDWREPMHPYRVRATTGATPERVTDAYMDTVGPLIADGPLSPDRKWRAVESGGDLYVVDLARATARRLTETNAGESDPPWSADGRRIFFTRDGNAFALTLADGFEEQLTDIRSGPTPEKEKPAEGQRGFLEAQQRELLAAVRDELRRDSLQKAERAAHDSLRIAPLYLAKGERVASLSVSPNGRSVLFTTTTAPLTARRVMVPKWVTTSGYTEEIEGGRTKVGDAERDERVGVMTLPAGKVTWVHSIPTDTTHSPDFAFSLGWNDDGSAALLFAVSREYKDRYLQRIDGASGAATVLDVLHDSAWVDGPCFGCGGWLPGGARVWYVSEADGFAHLYTRAADGSDRRQLTSGKWEVLGAQISDDRQTFLLTTNATSPFEQHFFELPVTGGTMRRITQTVGGHDVSLSPDGKRMADVYSAANKPPELYLLPHKPGGDAGAVEGTEKTAAQLTVSTTADWRSFPWIVPEIVMIPASDGVMVPARIYHPKDMGAQPNGAAVIFVHGAGYLHNVHKYWSDYSREYMFNQLLASKGYVVLDEDYRGSAGYGRDWRTAIYRHMGGRDLQDEVDASRYLGKEFGIAPEHVGIYGGSYGGFMTLMALFTEGSHFGAGAALRSVTDWAAYNHGYTARILNTPQTDSIAYQQSSPIYFAQGLDRPLLIAHGMVDTNVHFQDDVRLVERLIELGKTGWQLAVYPVENHGFVRPASWTDEYRRIFDLFQEHLPPHGTR
jgi:dipeptidyl aminopeptidase/acylaminoacyl peptidase